tara:strand:+ start:431 stop:1033 length:603 start_codon:yes stop_codon:yes gene_type:complete
MPKNPNARLDGLPDELIANIFCNLPDDPLAQLCLVSKRYHDIAAARLYERIDDSRPPGREYNMMKAVGIHNPSLGRYIKTLSTGKDNKNNPTWGRRGGMRRLFTRVLRSAVNLTTLNIFDHLDVGEDRRYIARNHGWIPVFDDAVRGQTIESSQPFQYLSTIAIFAEGGLGIEDVSSIFGLPAIKTIELRGFVEPAPMKA